MDDKSEYELQRIARLQRNQQVMKDLGLHSRHPEQKRNTKIKRSARQTTPKDQSIQTYPVEAKRQSSRLQTIPRPNYSEDKLGVTTSTKEAVKHTIDDNNELIVPSKRIKASKERTLFPQENHSVFDSRALGASGRKSCIEIDAKLKELRTDWVGRIYYPPPNTGAMKETVMNQIGTKIPIFSKYSGIQEFKNAVCVFANIGGSEYENVFTDLGDGTVAMDWFASSKVKPDSRIVHRLSDSSTPIFLFLRFEGEPYLGCGDCQIVETDLMRRPMRFRLKINCTRELRQRSKKIFEQLLKGERDDDDEEGDDDQ